MIKNRDIVMVGLQSMDINIGSNSVNLAREFARHNRVLYVNYAVDRLTLIRRRNSNIVQKRTRILKGIDPSLKQEDKNLWVLNPAVVLESVNRVRPKFLFDFLNKRNAVKLSSKINEVVQELDFKNFILFNDSDFYRSFYLKELLKPAVFVYYSRDNMISTDFFRKYGEKYEGSLMRKADAVVANSEYLRKKAEEYNHSSFFVGQGCDQELFSTKNVREIPAEIKKINSPRIGYVGSLTTKRLDLELLHFIAENKPEWNIVLTGPEDDAFRKSKLHDLNNVYFTGAISQELLPTYIYHFDVAINPQILNALTIGNYPRKIDEYLMMGKAVVATKTGAMDMFGNFVYTASTHLEFIDKITEALNWNSPGMANKRMLYAQEHSWEKSAENIYRVIIEAEKNKK